MKILKLSKEEIFLRKTDLITHLVILGLEVGGLGGEFFILVLQIFYSLFEIFVLEFPFGLKEILSIIQRKYQYLRFITIFGDEAHKRRNTGK